MKILALLFALTLPAQAILTVDSISGDENTLHAEFSVSWLHGTNQSVEGTWPGGEFLFIVQNGAYDPDNDEAPAGFYLRNFWNDGWNPGPVFMDLWLNSNTPTLTDFTFGLGNQNLADPVTFDFANTGLQYHLDASLFGDLSADGLGGSARLVFDLERTPVTFRDSGPFLPQQSVPEGGSTLLFSSVLLLLLWGKRASQNCSEMLTMPSLETTPREKV